MQVRNKENLTPSSITKLMHANIPRKSIYSDIEINNFTNNSLKDIGLLLKESREDRKVSLKELKEKTRIPLHHILSIESGEREKLPEDLYLIGFIKRYAKVLGLNEQLIAEMYLKGKKYQVNDQTNNQIDDQRTHYEDKDFDLLFDNETENEPKIFKFKPRNNSSNKNSIDKNFFKTYHLYLLIGLGLFLIAFYLMIKTITPPEKNSQDASDIVLENENNEADSFDEDEDLNEANNSTLENSDFSEEEENEPVISTPKPPVIKKEVVVNKPIQPIATTPKPQVKPIVATPKPQMKTIAKPINKQIVKTKPVLVEKKTTTAVKTKVEPKTIAKTLTQPKTEFKRLIIEDAPKIEIRKQVTEIRANPYNYNKQETTTDEIMLRPLH